MQKPPEKGSRQFARKPYRSPKLMKLGTMNSLVQGGTVTSEVDLRGGTKRNPGGPR